MDGRVELLVGAPGDSDGGYTDTGAGYILFLNPDGTCRSHRKISADHGDFTAELYGSDKLGSAIASIGDHDLNGVPDLALTATGK